MSNNEKLGEIATDLCDVFHNNEVPMLLIYIDKSDDDTANVRARHSATALELVSLAASGIFVLADSLHTSLGIDKEAALELAMDSIADGIRTAKAQSETKE